MQIQKSKYVFPIKIEVMSLANDINKCSFTLPNRAGGGEVCGGVNKMLHNKLTLTAVRWHSRRQVATTRSFHGGRPSRSGRDERTGCRTIGRTRMTKLKTRRRFNVLEEEVEVVARTRTMQANVDRVRTSVHACGFLDIYIFMPYCCSASLLFIISWRIRTFLPVKCD